MTHEYEYVSRSMAHGEAIHMLLQSIDTGFPEGGGTGEVLTHLQGYSIHSYFVIRYLLVRPFLRFSGYIRSVATVKGP